jgi:hypothetical protein
MTIIATIQPTTQNNLKHLLLVWYYNRLKNHHTTTTPPPHHHTGCDYNSGSSRQPRKLIFGMQPYSYPTRRNMEDDQKKLIENGRQPQFF